MGDRWAPMPADQDSPARSAFAIAPDDDTDLSAVTRGVYVGGAGDVAMILQNDSAAVTFAAVPAGTVLPVRAARIMATDTTATDLVGLY